MKGQDLIVALCLAASRRPWTFEALGEATGLSPSAAHAAVERLRLARLLEAGGWTVHAEALLELLAHGVRYVFPAQPGRQAVGVPTAVSVEAVRRELGMVAGEALVWPHRAGGTPGHAVEPLYRSAPEVALSDPALHELLALVDCIRVGRVRERRAAVEVLTKRLGRVHA